MRKIAILIPAVNEEVVIRHTLKSLFGFIPKRDVFVVDDGSTDKTSKVAKKYTRNVLRFPANSGKANAINKALSKFRIPARYDYVMPLDADSQITKDFLDKVLIRFEDDKLQSFIEGRERAVCVVGRVMSSKRNWITSYRMWEYEIAQSIHKNAQSKINSIIVCPGCSTVWRADIFRKVKIPTGTLAEDMDLTFTIYRKNLGQILFLNSATVTTQDPLILRDLLKQIERWYTGFWQCVLKHDIPWGGQMLDLEVSILALEGLFGGMIILTLAFAVPFALSLKPGILVAPLLFDFLLFVLPTLIYTSVKNKSAIIFSGLPQFYFLRIVSSLIFLKSFLKVVFAIDLKSKWNKARRFAIT